MENNENLISEKKQIALDKMRKELEGKRGQQYWRTLDEVTQTAEFNAWFEDEFPNRKELFQIDRRSLLKFAGASLALAGLTGCRGVFLPEEKLVPYVKAPEEVVPGKPLFYASAVTLAGYATGVVVEQHEGRPVKLEGNVDHPASLGALDSISQAEILNFYDPDRSQSIIENQEIATWEMFYKAARTELMSGDGSGVGFVFGTSTSPTLGWMVDRLTKALPRAKFYVWEPTGRKNVGSAVTFTTNGEGVPVYDFSKAKVIFSLDSDFMSVSDNPAALRYTRQFSRGRKIMGREGEMNRLYAVESTPGLVGSMADHRYPVKPSEVYQIACAMATALGVKAPSASIPASMQSDMAAIMNDLKANQGSCVVVAGEHHGPEVHQVVFEINKALGNIDKTVEFVKTPEVTFGFYGIEDLAKHLETAEVTKLFVSNTNPIYTAPADLKIAEKFAKAKFVAHHGLYNDETGLKSTWHVPSTHTLEAWGDARAFDGTATIMQPIIAPLFDGRSDIEVLSGLLGETKGGYDLVQTYWKSQGLGGAEFEKGWRTAIHNGIVPNTSSAKLVYSGPKAELPAPLPSATTEVLLIADPLIFDGRFANNGWLQETPKPLTKVVWDNVVAMNPADAEALGVGIGNDFVVRVETPAGVVEGVAFKLPGHPRGSVTINLGYGRTAGGTLATLNSEDHGGGFDAYKIRTTKAMTWVAATSITNTRREAHIASTQGHSPLGGDKIPDARDVIRDGTFVAFKEKGMEALKKGHSMDSKEIKEANLYPDEVFEWDGDQWGMTIDMNSCVGCGACITACQAENNISVVGKEQVQKGREMHWIRIDRYYSGSDENPSVTWQPIACVHCEKAPCEPVCPVAATVHSHEGLNQMVYNRCVGTRYCSNNCPYKVRRFNYLNWSDNQAQFTNNTQPWNTRAVPGPVKEPKESGIQLLKMLNNPDVTVRGRGVMEKCTYCVQRINEARIESKKAGKAIADGDIVTACQQACPGEAIVFGNIADKNSRVAKLRKDERSYLLLEELQTRPRTSHLAKLRNPNPEIKSMVVEEAHH